MKASQYAADVNTELRQQIFMSTDFDAIINYLYVQHFKKKVGHYHSEHFLFALNSWFYGETHYGEV